ncbi:hypothetical protein [Nocardia sp. NBC_00511]|uniref:hypothetical protein n=1 Tax=Nocardia sp. NBC_00511 TaxID=2903591 RepID=UPI002F90A71A
MTDQANEFDAMTPDEIIALTNRLRLDTSAARELLPPEGAAPELANVPRSVKLTLTEDKLMKARAKELGLTASAYFRALLARDLATPADRPLTTADIPMLVQLIRGHAA